MRSLNTPACYRRCLVCGSVFASPRVGPAQQLNNFGQVFTSGQAEERLATPRRPALQAIAGVLRKMITGGRLLDVGCYNGAFFEFFPRTDWELYGVEISPTAARKAASDFGAQVFTGELAGARFQDAYFDLVTLLDTFYYLAEPPAFLEEVRRILKPGGLLALDIPGQKFILTRSRGPLCWLIDHRWSRLAPASGYLHWISQAGLVKLLAGHGFTARGWETSFSPQRPGLAGRASGWYGQALSRLYERGALQLDWAPKYLCVAQRD